MKYISPGGWFSLEYPATWSEFEDTEETFLFYNPNKWSGNFRISAYKDAAKDYARQCIAYELKNNPTSTTTKELLSYSQKTQAVCYLLSKNIFPMPLASLNRISYKREGIISFGSATNIA